MKIAVALLIVWIQVAASVRKVVLHSPFALAVGQKKKSEHNKTYFEYKGIPYAQPPVGDLRFKAPVEILSTLDFVQVKESPVCIQKNYLFSVTPKIEGQEDCLYLNVYVPQKCETSETPCPVLVFFHWGGFFTGRATSGYLGPEYFMDRKVILVTVNYRLGPFGFLSTLDDEAPGNYGLKDQVAALKWIKTNIDGFSGNPDDVTIGGQSSGAASVHYHLMSPLSKDLFKKAISQSGTALAAWAFPYNDLQKMVTMKQGELVGCKNKTNKILIKCLKGVSAEKIMETQDAFRPFFGNPVGVYGPVVEKKSLRNPLPFITKTPVEYILNGEVRQVPWMIGVVSNEGVMKVKDILRTDEIREQLNSHFESVLTGPLLVFALSTADPHSLYKNVTEFYLGGKEYVDLNDTAFIQGLINLFTDRAFTYPLYTTLKLHSCLGHSPIYVYNFDYVGSRTYGSLFSTQGKNISFNWGNCHCDELLYLFKSPELFSETDDDEDKLLRVDLLDLWVNFIRRGNPAPTIPILPWRPIKNSCKLVSEEIDVYSISGNSKGGRFFFMDKGLYKQRMDFWSNANIFENAPFANTLDNVIHKNSM